MARITERSEALGITKPGTAKDLITLIKKYGLPTTVTDYNHQALLEAMTLDKKNATGGLHLILLVAMGKILIQKIKPADIHLYL